MGRGHEFKSCVVWIILNRWVRHIPCWTIRKLCYRVFGMKIGKNARIGIGTYVIRPRRIVIGDRTVINQNCYLDARGGLTIGQDVSISIGTQFISATHDPDSETFAYKEGAIEVKDNVWTGANAIILNDTVLEKGSIIGAGCVFKGKSVQDGIYVGNPAKLLRNRGASDYHLNYKTYFK